MKIEESNGVRLQRRVHLWVVSVLAFDRDDNARWKRLATYADEAPARALYEAESNRRRPK